MSLSNAPKIEDRVRVEAFLASSLDIEVPSSYRSIFDLAESILRDLRKVDEALYDAESLFIQSFMDWLQEWTSNNGNSLSDFLSSWKEASPKISSPDAGDSVRVMTIHKAKGLEFPYVILPFAEEITLYKVRTGACLLQHLLFQRMSRAVRTRSTCPRKRTEPCLRKITRRRRTVST